MKGQAQTILEVLNVHNFILKGLLIILCISSSLSCIAQNNKNTFEIKRELAKSGSFLNISLIDDINKKDTLKGFIRINGVFFDLEADNKYFMVQVAPRKYIIESFYFSKSPVKIKNIKVQKNDSLILKIYMKDDTIPID
jgi:hypothetical protein